MAGTGPDPFQSANQPGMYSGSGYDQMPTGPPPMGTNPYGPPPQMPPMATGPPQPNLDYQQYHEGYDGGETEGELRIDPETGIVPRNCTDCVCIPIFLAYMVVMFGIIMQGWMGGNPDYLTHGIDGKGRLCGTGDMAAEPYLFWCRANRKETTAVPSSLNLEYPSCVKECPTSPTGFPIKCLMEEAVTPAINTGGTNNVTSPGSFGIVENYFLQYVQEEAHTAGYSTKAEFGKYCMPSTKSNNVTERSQLFGLKEQIMEHTSSRRFVASFGTLGDCWVAVAITSLPALVLGFLYVRAMKSCGKYVLAACMGLCSLAFFASFLWFAFTFVWWFDGRTHYGVALPDWRKGMAWYQDNLTLFRHFLPIQATIVSYLACFVSLAISIGTYSGLYSVWFDERHAEIEDLIEAVDECIFGWGDKMYILFLIPVIDAVIKFFIFYSLGKAFMYQLTECWVDESRIVIRNMHMGSPAGSVSCTLDFWVDGKFSFDFWAWFKVFYYLYGFIWIYELTISLQQFIVSHSVILWYYSREEISEQEHETTALVESALKNAFKFHFGSIIYLAALNPINRFQRIMDSLLIDSIQRQGEPDATSPYSGCLDACCCNFSPVVDSGNKTPYSERCPGCYVCLGECEADPRNTKGLLAYIGSSGCAHLIRNCYKGQVFSWICHCGLLDKECWERWAKLTCNPHEIKGYSFSARISCVNLYDKNLLNDVIIRSNHFERAALRSQTIIDMHPMCMSYERGGHMGSLRTVNKCGVCSIASLCSFLAWIMCTTAFNDPKSDWYVIDPMMAALVSWFYSASVAYSFTMIMDHSADVLLWVYSWNKKYKKGSCEKFMPEHLKHIVGHTHLDHDAYPLYGKAEPDMYLGTWMSTRAAKKKEARERAPDIHDLTHGAHAGKSAAMGTLMRSIQG